MMIELPSRRKHNATIVGCEENIGQVKYCITTKEIKYTKDNTKEHVDAMRKALTAAENDYQNRRKDFENGMNEIRTPFVSRTIRWLKDNHRIDCGFIEIS